MTGVLGGVFDPPHNGHVAIATTAMRHFELERMAVLVASRPAHKQVETPAWARLRLADAAFPDYEVELDNHPYTVDAVAPARFGDAIFIVGADEFRDFLTWKDPDGVLERVRLGVATRPGYVKEQLVYVLERLSQPERVKFFDAPPVPVASSNIRRRLAAGEPIDGLVPDAVAELIDELELYRPSGTRG